MVCARCKQLISEWNRLASKRHCADAAESAYRAAVQHRLSCEVCKDRDQDTEALDERFDLCVTFSFKFDFS